MKKSIEARPGMVQNYARPILIGIAVAVVGLLPWTVLAPLNARINPQVPWAALATAGFLLLLVLWLHGLGPPRAWRQERRSLLRLWPPAPSSPAGGEGLPVPLILLLLGVIYLLWIFVGGTEGQPDLSAYPTTEYRFSVLVMGALVSGIVEEIAFRGYMQRGLERLGADKAILITSAVFTLFHGNHGLGALLLLGPGLFAASWLYGWLAVRTGTIVPGIIIHSAGDMAYTYFGLLGGDWRLLFA